jgi:serine-type D-Ala-D-Ala carboxypeptidase/endopeptidase (penicillin-binding protein 4)
MEYKGIARGFTGQSPRLGFLHYRLAQPWERRRSQAGRHEDSKSMWRRISCFFIFALVVSAAPAADPLRSLRADLDKIFSDKDFAGTKWGVEVYSLNRSEKLYEREPEMLCVPASTNKIITASVALLRLGADYQFKTRVLADGSIKDGVLEGNLVIAGYGDPSNSPKLQAGDPFRTFKDWAEKLKERSIHAISDDIVGDGSAFEEIPYGQGWEWNDLIQSYAAPVSALQFNENLVSLHIIPGIERGSIPSVTATPLADYLYFDDRIVTETENSAASIRIERGASDELVVLRGSVPLKSPGIIRDISVRFPIRYYLAALSRALSDQGIDISKAGGIRESGTTKSASLLWTHLSPPLSEIIKPMLKESLNLCAETFERVLGMELRGEGTFSKGREVVEETLAEMGIKKGSYNYADASGLSRLNLVSADTLVKILKFMHERPCFSDFYDSLPVAGCDGTLANRMKGTAAENNAHAKTGTLSNVSAISGYVRTKSGEMLAFSMTANNYLFSKARAESAEDAAIARLANFSRK